MVDVVVDGGDGLVVDVGALRVMLAAGVVFWDNDAEEFKARQDVTKQKLQKFYDNIAS